MRKKEFDYFKREWGDIYTKIKERIILRTCEFREAWEKGTDETLFLELVFCLLTPATRARSAWSALERLNQENLIFHGKRCEIARELNIVRFKNKKALSIVHARNQFFGSHRISLKATLQSIPGARLKREWLVSHVQGFGYKEASHFLRNIGLTQGIAILDRHILRNLQQAGIIDGFLESISRKRYIFIEGEMIELAKKINIPLEHLDFVLWYKETGDIFK